MLEKEVIVVQNDEDEDDFVKDNGYFLFMEDVEMDSCKKAIRWIMNENFATEDKKEFLTLVLTSPGGDTAPAFALIDTMRSSKIPIHTVGLGQISSSSFMIFITGEKGHRILTPNTSILSHQYSWGSDGKDHELFAIQKEQDLTRKRMLRHYKKCLGLSEKVIKEKLLPPSDVWLSAEEAKKLGICDAIKVKY